MEFTLIENTSDISHIKLEGRMDPYGTQQIRDRFRAATVEQDRPSVVDLTDVTFITSVGIGLLVDCADTVRRGGYELVLVTPGGHAHDVLTKTGIYTIVRSAGTLDEALALAQETSP